MSRWYQTVFCVAAMALLAGTVAVSAQKSTLGKFGDAVQDAGTAIKKGAQKTGEAIAKGAENTGDAIGKGIERTGDVLRGSEPENDAVQVQVPQPQTPRYLFVQQARNATTNGDRLILSGLTPSTYYFTDRPRRSAGHLRHHEFAALWSDDSPDSFKNDPPNAAVTTPGQIDDEPIVLELLTAEYDGSTLSFGFRVISGKLPQTADDVAIFIDSSGSAVVPMGLLALD